MVGKGIVAIKNNPLSGALVIATVLWKSMTGDSAMFSSLN